MWRSPPDDAPREALRWARQAGQRVGAFSRARLARKACSALVKVNGWLQSRHVTLMSVDIVDELLKFLGQPGWTGATRMLPVPSSTKRFAPRGNEPAPRL